MILNLHINPIALTGANHQAGRYFPTSPDGFVIRGGFIYLIV